LYNIEPQNANWVPQNEEPEVEKVEEEYQDGSVYYGEKENGLRHGFGKFSYSDGGVYEGEWKYGTMDGHGKLYYPSGKLAYDGNWTNN
jgi:antitoxin component YwqK of YwqJK toxin-antitoxin module